jgi:Holliday junction resolvase RusA-like endonuclease
MLEPVTIELSGIPRGKARSRTRFGQARPYRPKETKDFETALRFKALEAMRGRFAFSGPLRVTVWAWMPVPQSWSAEKQGRAVRGLIYPVSKPDCDNILKLALDPLNKIVFNDDAQVVDSHVVKLYSARPSLRIEVGLL